MGSSIVRVGAPTLVLFACSVLTLGQTTDSAKTLKPTGSISGKVTIRGKGVAGVAVSLRRSERSDPFEVTPRVVTDQDGNYKIINLAAGSYQVTPSAPAFVISDSPGRSRNVIVGEGEDIENINFSLVRGGVITGRITDAESRPVIQQQVRLLAADTPNARGDTITPVVYPVGSATTDDRGIYRMFGLMPGRYKVSVGRGDDTFSGLPSRLGALYKEVFYQDATELSKANVIEVGEGTEATNIDITLGSVIETFAARGQVIDGEKGEPIPFLRLGLQRLVGVENRGEFISSSASTTNARGEFFLEDLRPGKYAVYLVPEATSELRTDGTTFDVIDSDVSGITIRVVRGAVITGMVQLETNDKQALGKLQKLWVRAYVQTLEKGFNLANTAASPIGVDGSFRIAGLPTGNAVLSLSPVRDLSDMKGFLVRRIERDGIVQPRGMEVKEGEQVSGIRMIVDYGTAILNGRVNLQNGALPQGARIFVNLTGVGGSLTNLRPPAVDERGHFVAEGLPAGTYEVTVSIVSSTSRLGRAVRQQVVLQNNAVTEVTINFELSDSARP